LTVATAAPSGSASARAPESGAWVGLPGRGLRPEADTQRPHVRLGVLWFLAVGVSFGGGTVGLAVPYAAAAALGAAQTARSWRRVGGGANLAVAAAAAAGLPVATALWSRGFGAAVLVAVGASVAVATGPVDRLLADAGLTVRSWLFVGVAAASMVAVHRVDPAAALALFLLVSAFDTGDYLMGVDTRWPAVGTIAGMAAVAVLSFSFFVVALPPFGGPEVLVFGGAVAVLAPLGQIVASLVLPDGRAVASGLRRLDSLVLTGPAWLVLFALFEA
jgi:hypothetical protein